MSEKKRYDYAPGQQVVLRVSQYGGTSGWVEAAVVELVGEKVTVEIPPPGLISGRTTVERDDLLPVEVYRRIYRARLDARNLSAPKPRSKDPSRDEVVEPG